MSVKVNSVALAYAKLLIDQGNYVINTVWSRSAPTSDQENQFLDAHGWDDYARWYLAVEIDDQPDAKARYQFPVGDFRNLHRSGVVAAKQRAEQQHYADVIQAADDLLDLFDRLNAC